MHSILLRREEDDGEICDAGSYSVDDHELAEFFLGDFGLID